MKKLIYPIILFSLLIFSSCKKESPYAEYEGTWSGQYTGDDFGTWSTTINADGIVTGTAVSDSTPTFSFSLNGTVSESGLIEAQAIISVQTIDFTGQINNSSVSGDWINSSGIEGSWSGVRY